MKLPDIELVSAKVHEAWMKQKALAGVTSRKLDTSGEELLVPYEQLSEQAKELDRATVRAVYTAIESLGDSVAMTDTERLDKIEAAARQSIADMFGDDTRCGFIVSSDGDVLSGTIEDYPHATLREAVAAMEPA